MQSAMLNFDCTIKMILVKSEATWCTCSEVPSVYISLQYNFKGGSMIQNHPEEMQLEEISLAYY